ncbi:hypothetical protein SZN_27181 [Streptomyces zinciresistens K42]|uniref:Uncharacterized protein n=1 Tax=Streptomyces zinciresistens K42 TaxID=700597 RepID=G2GIU6_9ACTN|nr:hypothetical protein [Streptomyces zinciresistens]EGX56577.1 hypothetical protein SZN_27181 [Streptomyces zinciresistens K42]
MTDATRNDRTPDAARGATQPMPRVGAHGPAEGEGEDVRGPAPGGARKDLSKSDTGHGNDAVRAGAASGTSAPGGPPGTVRTATPGAARGGAKGGAFLAHDERDRMERQLHHAVAHFVDQPQAAVEEADRAVEDIVGRFTEMMTERRRTLRAAWQSGDGTDVTADTEQLRLALRDYRELAERLLRV